MVTQPALARPAFIPVLRGVVFVSGFSVALALLAVWVAPDLASVTAAGWVFFFAQPLASALDTLIAARSFLLGFNLVSGTSLLSLLVATRLLRRGRLAWHGLAVGHLVVGAVNVVLVGPILAILVFNLAVAVAVMWGIYKAWRAFLR